MPQVITALEETEKSKETQGSLSKINPPVGNVPTELLQPVQFYYGLYSVNKRRMADSNLAFLVENAAYKTVQIPPCPADQRYIKVTEIPNVVQWIENDPHNLGETVVRTLRGDLVCMGIVNPDVVAVNMDHLPADSALAKFSIASGCDLIKQGVFFTRAEEGTPEFEKQLKKAEERVSRYYRQLLGGLIGMSDRAIARLMESEKGVDYRMAAEHFGEELPGVRTLGQKVDCPNCFEKMPRGAAFHFSQSFQKICVNDWKRAVEAGVVKMADVPEGKRWGGTPQPDPGYATGAPAKLGDLTKAQLVEFGAQELGLTLSERSTKDELIAAIEKAAK